MKAKKIVLIVLVILLMLIVGVLVFNSNIEVEYVPESEIEEEDLRKTMVSLYFENAETKELQKETRLIDSKDLLLDPYAELIKMLIEGPENESLQKIIPEGSILLSAELKGDCLEANFSKEFIDNIPEDENEKNNLMNSITNTLTELNEVTSVRILVNNEEIQI